ncbi:hypothetical protein ILUMI_26958 [Ignelater luminosus]|uniref:Crossover junction endonuclease MUS81 n=1 Tax=Ignelater luminosus TaxID=2038154 RepID=A0A8K0C3W5_IGNLU|nr:hypothetical protein ILUMI_26958 [Ignelater luminosus]
MSSSLKRRVTVKLKNPNPLFEQWLIEWRDKAIESDSKMQYCFNKALQSLRKYPLSLESGRDCKILQGFGEKLCKMLDIKLAEYKQKNPNQLIDVSEDTKNKKTEVSIKNNNANINKEKYIPRLLSGAYAILITLYETSLKPHYAGYMFKTDIIRYGQHLCEKSFVKPDPGSYYTAWSSMKTLLEKKLVTKHGSPAKFSLTDEGLLLAHKLYTNNLKNSTESKHELNKAELESSMSVSSISPSSSPSHELQRPVLDIKNNHSSSSLVIEDYRKQDANLGIKNNSSLATVTAETTVTNYKKQKLDIDIKSSSSSSLSTAEEITTETQSETESVHSSATSQEETFIFAPNSFEIILYVDKQEVAGGTQNPLDDVTLAELTNLNVRYELKHLKVGDYTWICREYSTHKELVLPYIIERKRMDDFGKSIKDGRFHEQKFRLKQSGVQNLIYLIESHGNNTHTGLPMATLYQAATNTLLQDNFDVKFTNNIRETVEYLAALTSILKSSYQGKTLVSCPKQNLAKSKIKDDLVSLMTFQEFNKGASKSRNFKIQEMFVRQLLQLKGMSVEKALAIAKKYPTPKLLQIAYKTEPSIAGEKLLSTVQYGRLGKNIGPIISKTVYQLYSHKF